MNIKELAAYANVSVATISRVLNDDVRVKKETRERVKRAIAETGYTTNTLGRNLRISKSDVVLVVMPDMKNPFYADIVEGIDERCRQYGFSAMVCNTYDSHEKLQYYCGYIEKKQARGVILVSPTWKRDYGFLRGRPIVSCCESSDSLPCAQVDIDNVQAGYDATKYLLSLGAKRIALIGGGKVAASSDKRERGFRLAAEEACVKVDESLVLDNCFRYEEALAASRKLLAENPPDAVFATSDEMAIACMNVAEEKGLRVPEDIKIIGFDNIRFSTFVKPKLSTVDQPRYDIGVNAVEQLVKVLNGTPTQLTMCPYKLIRRGSTEKGEEK